MGRHRKFNHESMNVDFSLVLCHVFFRSRGVAVEWY